jgi:hypothetical protein
VTYQNPSLFGVAYASRLFREVDEAQAFEKLRDNTGRALDLQYPDTNGHAQALLKWLNKWGCRIPKKAPGSLFQSWAKWWQQWNQRLPNADLELVNAGECDLV